MGSIGPFQILIIALVILVLFGRGRISEMMGDFGKGVKSFRKGLTEEEKSTSDDAPSARIEGPCVRRNLLRKPSIRHRQPPATRRPLKPIASERR